MSISETWYAIKDHGTNYCNLYNLIEGKSKQQNAADIIGTLLLIIQFPLIFFFFCPETTETGMDRDWCVTPRNVKVFVTIVDLKKDICWLSNELQKKD